MSAQVKVQCPAQTYINAIHGAMSAVLSSHYGLIHWLFPRKPLAVMKVDIFSAQPILFLYGTLKSSQINFIV